MLSKLLHATVVVSKLGYTSLIFVDPGDKVNGAYYRNVLLLQQLLPTIHQVSGEFFVFQQHSAPAHRARETFGLLERETLSYSYCYLSCSVFSRTLQLHCKILLLPYDVISLSFVCECIVTKQLQI